VISPNLRSKAAIQIRDGCHRKSCFKLGCGMGLQPFATPKKHHGIGILHGARLIDLPGTGFFVVSHGKEAG
jgi:hypothetical protein